MTNKYLMFYVYYKSAKVYYKLSKERMNKHYYLKKYEEMKQAMRDCLSKERGSKNGKFKSTFN